MASMRKLSARDRQILNNGRKNVVLRRNADRVSRLRHVEGQRSPSQARSPHRNAAPQEVMRHRTVKGKDEGPKGRIPQTSML